MKHLLLTLALSAAPVFGHAAFVDVDLPGTTFVFGTIVVDGTGLFGPGDTLYFEPLAGAYGRDVDQPPDSAPDVYSANFVAQEAGQPALTVAVPGPLFGSFHGTPQAAFQALRAAWDAAVALDPTPDAFSRTIQSNTQIQLYAPGDNSNPQLNSGFTTIRIHVNGVTPIPLPAGALLFVSALGALGLTRRRRPRT